MRIPGYTSNRNSDGCDDRGANLGTCTQPDDDKSDHPSATRSLKRVDALLDVRSCPSGRRSGGVGFGVLDGKGFRMHGFGNGEGSFGRGRSPRKSIGGARLAALASLARKTLAVLTIYALLAGQLPAYAWADDGLPQDAGTVASQVLDERHDSGADDGASVDGAPGAEGADTVSDGDAAGGENADNAASMGDGAEVGAGAADGTADAEVVTVTAQVIGRDANGNVEVWAASGSYELAAGSTAADLTEQVFKQHGIAADYGTSQYGWYLNTITSPTDPSLTLGWDEGTGRYWQLFENGAASEAGASSVTLEDGDAVTWYYSAYDDKLPADLPGGGGSEGGAGGAGEGSGSGAEDPESRTAYVRVVGATEQAEDGSYTVENWVPLSEVELPAGSEVTAWELFSAALDEAGCTYSTDGGFYPSSITSPDGLELGTSSAAPYSYWSFTINGEHASEGANTYKVQPGDTVELVYTYGSGSGSAEDSVEIDPSASRPDWDAAWSGQGNAASAGGAVTDAPTATEDGEALWVTKLETYASDPLVVNGRVYTVVGSNLVALDAETGAEVARGKLVASAGFVSPNMAYGDGLILVPLAGGRLQALTADTLTTVWVTDALPDGEAGSQQSQTTVTVKDGYAYFGTVSATWSSSYGGYLVCVNLENGAIRWQYESSKGYYWSGALAVDGYVVIADDGGTLSVLNAKTGAVVDEAQLSAGSRSGVVSDGEGGVVAVTSDGTLHRYLLSDAGELTAAGSVKFGSSATGAPAVSGGKAYVGGTVQGGYAGQLAVVDLEGMTIEHLVTTADGKAIPGAVQSSPLVSVQQGGAYVYFTANARPGGVYCYRVGDDGATTVFTPDAAYQQYCNASVVCDENGVMYYRNDSGTMFAIAPGATQGGGEEPGGNEGGNQGSGDVGQPGESTPGSGDNNDSDGGNGNGGGAGGNGGKSDRGGAPAPSMTPVSEDAEGNGAGSDDASSGDSAESAAEDGVSPQARAAAMSATAGETASEDGGLLGNPVLVASVAGLAVGVAGLVGIAVWWTRSRRMGE